MSSNQNHYSEALTPEGYQRIEQELVNLSTHRRAEIAEEIRNAREFGDITENSEYQSAKEAQAFLETRILQLKERLRRATVVAEQDAKGVAAFGMLVHVKDQDSGASLKFRLVGTGESDPGRGMISVDSPVGAALLGCGRGSVVTVRLPSGKTRQFKVTKVSSAPAAERNP